MRHRARSGTFWYWISDPKVTTKVLVVNGRVEETNTQAPELRGLPLLEYVTALQKKHGGAKILIRRMK